MRRARGRTGGFTLIELLVALAVFAVLAIMAYGGLDVVLKARARVEEQADRLAEIQMTFTIMSRDIEQAVIRPVRDDFGDAAAAMLGTASSIEFTRAGWRNPAGLRRSELQRVGYVLDGNDLKRLSWATLDRSQGSEPRDTTVLSAVDAFEIRYLTPNGEWLSYWPMSAADAGVPPALPRAIEITVESPSWGRITRLFRTTGTVNTGEGSAP